jgi:hypothetical protein
MVQKVHTGVLLWASMGGISEAMMGYSSRPMPDSHSDSILETTERLRRTVSHITTEEFRWQDSHYNRDSRYGRELLFLISNSEWIRATSEVIDITRSDSVDTTIKIDVDIDQITHEAFHVSRTRSRPRRGNGLATAGFREVGDRRRAVAARSGSVNLIRSPP